MGMPIQWAGKPGQWMWGNEKSRARATDASDHSAVHMTRAANRTH